METISSVPWLLPRVRTLLRRTAVAVRGSLSRRDGRTVFAGSTAGYLLVYLVGIGHLTLGDGDVGLTVAADPLARLTEQMAPFQFEPVALVALGPVDLLVAPGNLLLGSVLAVLVGLNFAVSWVAWRGPTACRIGPGAGAAAGVPGILSGFACCGPTVLIVVGVQASSGLIAVFQWLVPIAGASLVASLLWVGNQVQPD